jgi:hypothetical protein
MSGGDPVTAASVPGSTGSEDVAALPLKLAFEANKGGGEEPVRWQVRNAEGWPVGSAWVIDDGLGAIVQVGDRLTRALDVREALAGMNAWLAGTLDAPERSRQAASVDQDREDVGDSGSTKRILLERRTEPRRPTGSPLMAEFAAARERNAALPGPWDGGAR